MYHIPYSCRKSNFEALVEKENITVIHSGVNRQDSFSFGKFLLQDNSMIYKIDFYTEGNKENLNHFIHHLQS